MVDGVKFWFVETPHYLGNGVQRLRNMLGFGRRLARDSASLAAKCGSPDLVVASTPHPFYLAAARKIAKRFDARFWIEVRDLWPDGLVELGNVSSWHPMILFIAAQERAAYRGAERVVSLLRGAEMHMRERGLAADRFVWIPNGVSEQEIHQATEKIAVNCPLLDRMNELKLSDKKLILYAGAMGPPNGLELLIEAASLLEHKEPDIHFLLVGGGASQSSLRSQARHLKNIDFWREVDRPIAQAAMRISDCAVSIYRKSALFDKGISPNKLFDYCLFAPRCVIACEPEGLVGLENLATCRCDPADAGLLAQTLVNVLRTPSRAIEERITRVSPFSYSQLAKSFLD